jgi:hypothetical protein
LTRNIIEAKCLYYDKLIIKSKNRTKTTWNTVKSLSRRKAHDQTIPNLSASNKIGANTIMVAESFNKYFLSITETIVKSTLNNRDILDICNKMNEYLIHIFKNTFPPISYSHVMTNEIENIIDRLKMTNSNGYDEIPIKVLKNCKHVIISPLTYIINRSLATGIFPDLICNYRPISLLTSFSKIFERVMFVRLHHHLTINNILANEQFGFRTNSSTEKAINKLLDQTQCGWNILRFEKGL